MALSDVERLLAAFDAGELLRPSPDVPNLVDLAKATASLAEAENIPLTSGARILVDLVGPHEHLVFVLADGFGMNFVEAMDGEAFASGHVAAELRTVFPSTTSAALTTLATAEWPVRHAVLGWFLYLPEVDAVTTILPFIRRSDGTSLTELGVTPKQAFPQPPVLSRIQSETLSLFPEDIVGSVYSGYYADGTPRRGYKRLKHAVDEVIKRAAEAEGRTYTYVYWPKIDSLCHEHGTRHRKTADAVEELDLELYRLSVSMPAGTRILVTADHGLLDADESQTHWIEPGDGLASCLVREPSGDAREVYFSLRMGQEARFRDRFSQRFDGRFVLLTVEEAVDLELFGPGLPSPESRERLGDLVAISLGADAIRHRFRHTESDEPHKTYASHHSGLTPAEMRIPLILI